MTEINRKDCFLPHGQVWVGFDANGRSVAVSIERLKPSKSRGDIMHGCVVILKCKNPGGKLFGKVISDFETVK